MAVRSVVVESLTKNPTLKFRAESNSLTYPPFAIANDGYADGRFKCKSKGRVTGSGQAYRAPTNSTA
jgi:hypothetical protein